MVLIIVSTLTVDIQGDGPINDSNSNIIHRAGKDAVVFSLCCESNAALIYIITCHSRGSFH